MTGVPVEATSVTAAVLLSGVSFLLSELAATRGARGVFRTAWPYAALLGLWGLRVSAGRAPAARR